MSSSSMETDRLIQSYLSSTLVSEEAERLIELAEADPGVLDSLIRQLRINAMLKDIMRGGLIQASLAQKVAEQIEHRDHPLAYHFHHHPVLLTLAGLLTFSAAVLLPVFLWLGGFFSRPIPSVTDSRPIVVVKETVIEKEKPVPSVAVLESAFEALWEDRDNAPEIGAPLFPGELRLLDGVIKIRFHTGAVVLVEGRSTVRLLTQDRTACLTGKLSAVIPESAVGFRVDLLKTSIIDLGTVFSVEVSGDRSEVQTLLGAVLSTHPSQQEKTILKGGEALRIDSANRTQRYRADLSLLEAITSLANAASENEQDSYEHFKQKRQRRQRVLLPDVQVIATKGISERAPENTLGAFRHALEFPVDACELDVLMAADGELFVQYPEVAEKYSSKKQSIRQMTSARVRAVKLPYKKSGSALPPEETRIPTLDEVLEVLAPSSCMIVIDVFENSAVEPVLEKIRNHSIRDRVILTTPSSEIVSAFKRADPAFCVGLLVDPGKTSSEKDKVHKILSAADRCEADFVRIYVSHCSASLFSSLKKEGLPVWCYFSADDDESRHFEKLLEIGVDGIMTTRADLLIPMKKQTPLP